jgi:signal transduction histidine kinase/CheY-like chemotaxis protein
MMAFELTHHIMDVIVPIFLLVMIFYVLFLKRRVFLMSLNAFQLARKQKQIKKELEYEQDQSQIRIEVIELALDGIALLSSDGQILYGNRALWNIFDVPQHKKSLYSKKSWLMLYGEKGQAYIHDHVLPILKEKGEWRGQGPVQLHNGLVIHGDMTLKSTHTGHIIGIIRDISERVLAETIKEQHRTTAWQNDKAMAMGRMARGMVHDLNNSLASIVGYAEFLTDDLDHASDQGRYARAILESSHRMIYILDQIAVLAPKAAVLPDQCDVIDAIEHLLLRQEFNNRVHFNTSLSHIAVPLSKNHFMRIIECVLKNALEENLNKNVALDITVITPETHLFLLPLVDEALEINDHLPLDIHESHSGETHVLLGTLCKNKTYLCVRICDEGNGIHKACADMMFDPFFSTKSPQYHPGLGLAVVRGLLTLHKGALELRSKQGEGTSICILLPLGDNHGLVHLPDQTVYDYAIGRHVVIIDDQENFLTHLSESLLRQKLHVSAFTNPLEALDFIRDQRHHIDLVMTDHQMPEMSGGELATELKADFKDLPIVLMSGFYPDPLPSHIDHFIKKPISAGELNHILHVLIGKATVL